jgi:hypothetical protein
MKRKRDETETAKIKQHGLNPGIWQNLRMGMLVIWICTMTAAVILIHPSGLSAEKERKNRLIQGLITDFFPFYANQPWEESFLADSGNIYPVRGGAWPAPIFSGERFGEESYPGRLLGFAFAMPVKDCRNARLFIGFDCHGRVAGYHVLSKSLLRDYQLVSRSSISPRAVNDTVKSAVIFFNANRQLWIQRNQRQA